MTLTSMQTTDEEEEQDPLTTFMFALKAAETRRQWPKRLKMFFNFVNLQGSLAAQSKEFVSKARQNTQWAEHAFIRFIGFQQERVSKGEISISTIPNYYKAAKLFCEMNGLVLNWKKLSRGLPRKAKAADDRPPTIEEIRKLVKFPDRRIKPIIYTMASSGFRIGAWNYLRWKHVIPLTNNECQVIAAELIVYAGDSEEYLTFATPEAYQALKEWIEFRKSYGEMITGESWVMRDLWQTTNVERSNKNGLATCPKKLKHSGIKRVIEDALWEQGLRDVLPKGVKRHEWKAAHGFRKFYKSRAEQAMKSINVEITMGHDIGVSASYYKPSERELLEDYLKAVPLLTINGDNLILQKQITELTEKTNNNDYLLNAKLQEKDDALVTLSDQVMKLMVEVQELKKRNQS